MLWITTAYKHRVVARKVHPSLLGIAKTYVWATKFPHANCAKNIRADYVHTPYYKG